MRKTKQRKAIKNAFRETDRPLSPNECLEAASLEVPNLGIATVYRHIKQLADEGWLTVVALPTTQNRYEVANTPHHHHFHCSKCDGVFDVEACPGQISAMTPTGFELADHEIILYGRCSDCTSR